MAKSQLREYAESLLVSVVLAALIILFIAQSFLVEGSSMEPSFHDGQRLMVEKVSYRFSEPKRGDVVVFRYPGDPRRKFIKRVIGLPGDEIVIKNGFLHINGQRIEEDYINGPTYGTYSAPTFGPVLVPEGHYFVLGDNRRNSDDSRYPDVGFVPRKNIVGRALFVYWPLSQVSWISIPPALERIGTR
ncbi:MAG TPA: signal peptidase I [Limnochordia bacterium]|jgi:signal peptidase I|nr:signal peptidase I [Limnochordia bacterium]HPP72939.1 signal peptidase I [Limnochordia bacterium]